MRTAKEWADTFYVQRNLGASPDLRHQVANSPRDLSANEKRWRMMGGMSDAIKRSRTDTYEHTINGLLTKRADLFNEAERIRDRLAEIKNDIAALDRVLGTLGYGGNLDAEMPRQKRQVIFGTGELTRAILDELRDAPGPLSSRDIARAILAVNEQDARDRKLLTEHVRRVSKALRVLKQRGYVAGATDAAGNMMWRRSQPQ